MINGSTIALGTWKQNQDTIILHSTKQPDLRTEINYELLSINSYPSDSVSIIVRSYDGELMPMANCIFTLGSITILGGSTNFDGEVTLPKVEADYLEISFVGHKTIKYKLDNSVSHYEFEMQEGDEFYRYFSHEVLIYQNGRLYDALIEGNTLDKYYYHKIK